MRKLNELQLSIYNMGGLLVVAGAMLYLVPSLQNYAPWVFTLGAIAFSFMQIMDGYEGSNIVIRRLRRQQVTGAIVLVATGFVMYMNIHNISPFRGTEWMIFLMVAAVLELYTSFRIPAELKKENEQR